MVASHSSYTNTSEAVLFTNVYATTSFLCHNNLVCYWSPAQKRSYICRFQIPRLVSCLKPALDKEVSRLVMDLLDLYRHVKIDLGLFWYKMSTDLLRTCLKLSQAGSRPKEVRRPVRNSSVDLSKTCLKPGQKPDFKQVLSKTDLN